MCLITCISVFYSVSLCNHIVCSTEIYVHCTSSLHLCLFVPGEKSDDPLSPDYLPTIFSHVKSPKKRKLTSALDKYDQRHKLKARMIEEEQRNEAAEELLNLSLVLTQTENKDVEQEMHH